MRENFEKKKHRNNNFMPTYFIKLNMDMFFVGGIWAIYMTIQRFPNVS